jgi:NitT/TauT family transport system substrate-binding protein
MRIAFRLLLTALVFGAAGPAALAADVIRVGYTPAATHATPVVGFSPQRLSYYKAFPGVRFPNRLHWTGDEAIASLRAGALDLAFVDAATAIRAWEKTPDIFVLAGAARGGVSVVSRKDIIFSFLYDARGRTIAVPQAGDIADVLFRYQMALNGLRSRETGGTVSIAAHRLSDLPGLFRSGRVDAACLAEPWAAWLQAQTGARLVAGPRELFAEGGYPTTLLVARRDWVIHNPETARRFIKATDQITREVARNNGWLAPLLASEMKRLGAPPVSEETMRKGVQRCRFTTDVSERDLQVFANLLNVSGYRKGNARLNGILWR